MPETAPLTLDSVSVLLVWTAIAIYALAFIAYAVDLARAVGAGRRREGCARARTRSGARLRRVAVGARRDRAGVRDQERVADEALNARPARSAAAAVGAHRHVADRARVPLPRRRRRHPRHRRRAACRGRTCTSSRSPARCSSSRSTSSCCSATTCASSASFITGLVVLLLGGATLAFYVEIVPLMDPLKSVWLVIHVFVASLATALFALAFGLSVLQLMQARRERKALAADDAIAASAAEDRPGLPAHAAERRGARVARLPLRDPRVHLLDLHAHRRVDLGERRVGPLLGLRHQGSLDLRHLGALRRLHPRARDPRLARLAVGVAVDHRLHAPCCSTSRS